MKKHSLPLLAILLSLFLNSFTLVQKKVQSYKFRYVPINNFSSSAVADVTNWIQAPSLSCDDQNSRPCSFIVTDEKYVHDDGFGGRLLNDAVYMNGSPELNDVIATINVTEGLCPGKYIVDKTNPSNTTTSIVNCRCDC